MIKVLFITGPTAIGKTGAGITAAIKLNGEIISADSRQFYKYMDIGTAKPTEAERKIIPHHMIDILYPDEYYSAGKFGKDSREIIRTIAKKGKTPVVVGGSGLYLKAIYDPLFDEGERNFEVKEKLKKIVQEEGISTLYMKLQGIDPEAAGKIMPNDEQRIIRALEVYETTGTPISKFWKKDEKINFMPVLICLNLERELLYEKINKRVDQMLEDGFINEVKQLKEKGYSQGLNSLKSVGYKEILQHFEGILTYSETVDLIKQKTRNYAKRQITWFKKEENFIWLDITSHKNLDETAEKIIEIFNNN